MTVLKGGFGKLLRGVDACLVEGFTIGQIEAEVTRHYARLSGEVVKPTEYGPFTYKENPNAT